MSNIKNINCPNCNHQFDVEEALAGKLEADYKLKISKVSEDLKLQFAERQKELETQQAAFEETKKKENEIFKAKLNQAKDAQEEELKKQILEQHQNQTATLKKQLEDQRKKTLDLKDKELELERMKGTMAEQEKVLALKYEKQMQNQLSEKETAIAKRLQEQIDLKIAEKDKLLNDQNKLIEELKRKKDQGSMQLQGEVQELAIEEMLRAKFPFDLIEEVPKGVRGADSLQTVINSAQQVCGKIIYESKRTKAFAGDWIEKLKVDQRSIGADIAVLITETMPKDMDQFGFKEGVWVCNFHEFSAMVSVLRQGLIKTQSVRSVQENKGDKMEVLYNFVTSEEFKQQIVAIVEGFSSMKQELDREKRAMQNIWKKREKQIELVIDNTVNMHASIKGIAGNSIPTIEILELDADLEAGSPE